MLTARSPNPKCTWCLVAGVAHYSIRCFDADADVDLDLDVGRRTPQALGFRTAQYSYSSVQCCMYQLHKLP